MGGSPSAPQQTAKQKEAEQMQIELMERQLEEAKNPTPLPKIKTPKPLPPPPPPAMMASSDTAAAADDARRKAMRRTNTARGTIFAGETGGALGGAKTLLG